MGAPGPSLPGTGDKWMPCAREIFTVVPWVPHPSFAWVGRRELDSASSLPFRFLVSSSPCSLVPFFPVSIQPRQKRLTPRRLQMIRNIFRRLPVIARRPDAHPITALACKFNHIRSRISAQQFLLQIECRVLAVKRANLHAPPPANIVGLRRRVDIHPHPRQSRAINAVAFAAAIVRSRIRPPTNGPRSVIRITAVCPVVRFVTAISDPIGSVRFAAVIASSSNTCPFAARRPLYGAEYHVAYPVSLKIGWCVAT